MKNLFKFSSWILLAVTGFTSCIKENSPVIKEKLPVEISMVFPPVNPNQDSTLSDVDGNFYKTVKIGDQTWMAENLKTTRYFDKSEIPLITDDSKWISLKTGGRRWYENDEATYKNLYGALYNWYTVKTGKLCPVGWHVPSDEEWKKLEMSLGMTREETEKEWEEYGDYYRGTDQGTQMKTTSGWKSWEGINGNGTNTSGFSALPAGDTDWYGHFELAGCCTTWWALEPGIGREVNSGTGTVGRAGWYLHTAFSVRCLKD